MLMFTSNQYLVQTPMHNIYSADERWYQNMGLVSSNPR
jgi:hypothetical protein